MIIDTERDGHRVAFNETFKDFGFNVDWDIDYYHELLQIGGGKERMKYHLHTKGFGKDIKPEEEDELIQAMHKHKTMKFIELIKLGRLPLRPGIKRFMKEAMDLNLILGICTTSNEEAARAIGEQMLGDISFNFVLAGDVVEKKKPAPDIYLLALEKSGLKSEEVVVVEDSRNGVQAAKAAGLRVIVTTNYYTEKEDVSQGDIVITCLGDPNGEKGILKKGTPELLNNGVLSVKSVLDYFSN